MIGQISYRSTHKGDLYSVDDVVYALCNGQALSRATYPRLSYLWPSGAYGSTDTSIHLPDLNGVFLRANDFSRNVDPNVYERFALSGVSPSGIVVGSYQLGDMRSHDHALGSASLLSVTLTSGSGGTRAVIVNFSQPTRLVSNSDISSTISSFTIGSGTTGESWMPAHIKFYPYIRVL